jgi:hypothetical protein
MEQGQSAVVIDNDKIKEHALSAEGNAPTQVIEQGMAEAKDVKPTQTPTPKAKANKSKFAVLNEPEEEAVKDWEKEYNDKVVEIERYKKVFERPYLRKFLEAEDENKDVWKELEMMVESNPAKMSDRDVYRKLLIDEGISEYDLDIKVEAFDDMSAFDQRQITKGKRNELTDEFNKGKNAYDINKFYERNKPDEKTLTFVTELLDSVLSNNGKPVEILANYTQSAELTAKIEKALKSGIDGGFTAGFAKTPQEAYTNLVMMLDQKNFLKHIIDSAYVDAIEGKTLAQIDDAKARPYIRNGQTAENGIDYREAIRGGISRKG